MSAGPGTSLIQRELKAVVKSSEAATAYSALARCLNEKARIIRHMVGWHGGHREVTVRWHERWGFWVVLNPRMNANHFWIGFGLQNPSRHKILGITCEINPSKSGINRRSAGVFLRDSGGNLMLGHSGKVGGGRPGIGKQAFLKSYEGKLRPAVWSNGSETVRSDVVVIGKIKSSDFLHKLSNFIVAVDSFKQGVKGNKSTSSAMFEKAYRKAEAEGDFDPDELLDSRERLLANIVIRRGQNEFRKKLLREYGGRCAITGCDCLDALEAAHIRPYWGVETNHISNGLLLRSDFHTLFDLQKLSITDQYRVLVSKELRNTVYGKFHGKKLDVPRNVKHRPNLKVLAMHRSGVKP